MSAGIPTELQDLAFNALELAVNRALTLDKASLAKIQAMEGDCFQLECTEPQIRAYIRISAGRVELDHRGDNKIRSGIRGSAKEFANILTADDAAAALINGNVQVIGDTAPLLAIQGIIKDIDIDWEEPLSQLFGDVAAHQIGQHLRTGSHWVQETASELQKRARKFLVEDSEIIAEPSATESLYQGIEALRARTERFEARLKLAKNQLAALKDKKINEK